MKTFGRNRCRLIATMALVMLTLPLAGVAQEEARNDEPLVSQQSSQRRFVSDKLVLNVYAEPDQGSARVATIQTGDIVEELERAENLVRVRLEDGREGWVGAGYLTTDEPAATRLRELQRQQKSVTRGPDKEAADEIARLKKENVSLQAQVNKLQSSVLAPAAQVVATSAPEVVSDERKQAGPALNGDAGWSWLIAVMIAGALGFAGGYQTLARRLRRRFGGLKIY